MMKTDCRTGAFEAPFYFLEDGRVAGFWRKSQS